MIYNPKKHHRRSIRLKEYNYSQAGMYFITIRTYKWGKIFGKILNGKMYLNEFGSTVKFEWLKTSKMRVNIDIDEFVIMPDHFHGIIIINEWYNKNIQHNEAMQYSKYYNTMGNQIEQFGKSTKNSIPTIIKLFKSSSTKKINNLRNTPGKPVWQRNYYERLIRNEKALYQIRTYIRNNPLK